MDDLVPRLLIKSEEAFAMAIETYNKPTIKYRVEGFAMFICNAWELMLKAHLIKKFGAGGVYYPDSPGRTFSLEVCIKKVFTNEKAPLRLNLEKIIELRNISTHFITEEYEMLYVPLFQSCVFNFTEKMKDFHEIDMSDIIPQNFLTLAVSMKSFNLNEIRAKYPEELVRKIVSVNNELEGMKAENNHAFAIRIEHYHYLTKDKAKATTLVGIDNSSEDHVKIIKELKDPNDTHKYSAKNCMAEVNRRLSKLEIPWKFNNYHFDLFCKYFELKNNPSYCYTHRHYDTPTYSYSTQMIDFIVDQIKKDPDIVQVLKERLKQRS